MMLMSHVCNLHLCTVNNVCCQERNKPKEPPKAPEKAPFFLPTVAGVVPKFDVQKTDQSEQVLVVS